MASNSILSNLTAQQLEAVTHRDGPMLVVAGAGSGKTRVVTRRIAWLISQGVAPYQILAMTFTNKAAREMRERIEALVGHVPQNIGTFHSCCARFLRSNIDLLKNGRNRNFVIYDDSDQKSLMTQILRENNFRAFFVPAEIRPSTILAINSASKNRCVSIAEACPDSRLARYVVEIRDCIEFYERVLAHYNAVDFDDLLLMMLQLLDQFPALAESYHQRFRYMLVDEYQDTNHLQYELVMRLTNAQHNIHVTGDPDQSIYSWRGADYSNIMSFQQDFPEARIVKLEQNYRSTPTILNAANSVISHNGHRIPKALFTKNPDGVQIIDVSTKSESSEAAWIAQRIELLHVNHGFDWHDFAILYRTNMQSRAIEENLVKARVPYQLLGGLRFYDRKEIRDFIALLRFYANPIDEVSFRRIFDNLTICDGLGPKTFTAIVANAQINSVNPLDYMASQDFLDTMCNGKAKRAMLLANLYNWANKLKNIPREGNAVDTITAIDEATGFRAQFELQYGVENVNDRNENIKSFYARAGEFCRDNDNPTIDQFLQDLALVADIDNHDPSANSVVLMTLHSAKGLEFPVVFIPGVEEGLLPHARACEDITDAGIEEERRLFYVGITRAKRALFLSHVKTRFTYGRQLSASPSRFINEIPSKLIDHIGTHDW